MSPRTVVKTPLMVPVYFAARMPAFTVSVGAAFQLS